MNRDDVEILAAIRAITGVRLRLGEYDRVHKTQTTENTILVSVYVMDVTDTTRETRHKRAGWKIYTISRVAPDSNRWWLTDTTDTIWDDTFVPYTFEKFSRYESQAEINARAEWEKMCHRPGTPNFPMDNEDRKYQGYDYYQNVRGNK